MNHYVEPTAIEDDMYYVLYDLRRVGVDGLATIHLPSAEEAGPVLLEINTDDYGDIVKHLRELICNEGDFWLSHLIILPRDTTATTDLKPLSAYILIVHSELLIRHIFYGDQDHFFDKIATMKKWLPN